MKQHYNYFSSKSQHARQKRDTKDEVHIKPCQSLDELEQEIDEYMIYYNNYSYQWGLTKKDDPCSIQKSSS